MTHVSAVPRPTNRLHCWFCLSSQHEVDKLFPGLDVPPHKSLIEIARDNGGEAAVADLVGRAQRWASHPLPYICDRCVRQLAGLLPPEPTAEIEPTEVG